MDHAAKDTAPLMGLYNQPDFVLARGRGCRVWDEDGREYLDFTAGIAVTALGHASPVVTQAIQDSLETGLLHTSNLYATRPGMELAHLLVDRAFPSRVFFCNSGAEANEAALKFARRWAGAQGPAHRTDFIAFRGAFHGRLFGTLALTDREAYQAPFRPLMPGVHFADIGDLTGVEALMAQGTVAAVFIEPLQGEGGIRPVDPDFLRGLRRLCDQSGALLVFDEIQCGLGRTGRAFAHQHAGVVPDLMTLAKPLAGGLPMGAVLAKPSVAEALHPGDHGTTFGGGPLVAHVAHQVVKTITDPDFLARVSAAGARLRQALQTLVDSGLALEVRGMGLMVGLVLEGEAGPVVSKAREQGLLLVSAGPHVIRLVPPLVISDDEIDEGVGRLRAALD